STPLIQSLQAILQPRSLQKSRYRLLKKSPKLPWVFVLGKVLLVDDEFHCEVQQVGLLFAPEERDVYSYGRLCDRRSFSSETIPGNACLEKSIALLPSLKIKNRT